MNMYPNQQPNYSYMQPQSYMRPVQQPMIKGRPVTSLEEARAASIDFDGSVFYFPDIANKRIYTKQINLDGTATMNMYELKEIPVTAPAPEQQASFVTREEFEQVLTQLRADILQATNEQQNKIVF